MAIQAIRNAKGNSVCVDCGAPSEHRGAVERRGRERGSRGSMNAAARRVRRSARELTLRSVPRPHVGQPEPGRAHLHRMFWHSPEPGHTPVPRSFARSGRLAAGADPGADGHWQRHGQPRVGERHARPRQAHAGLLAVRVRKRAGAPSVCSPRERPRVGSRGLGVGGPQSLSCCSLVLQGGA